MNKLIEVVRAAGFTCNIDIATGQGYLSHDFAESEQQYPSDEYDIVRDALADVGVEFVDDGPHIEHDHISGYVDFCLPNATANEAEDITFNITVTMKSRWVPHFVSMLRYMERLGNIGSSRMVGLYADGDGDFHPKFEFGVITNDAVHKSDNNGDRTWDAG